MDSLNAVFKNTKEDTLKLQLLWKLCEACDVNENLKYGTQGLEFTNQLLSEKPGPGLENILQYKAKFLGIIRYYYYEKQNLSKQINLNQELSELYTLLKDTLKAENAKVEQARNLIWAGQTLAAFDTLKTRLRHFETSGRPYYVAYYYRKIGLSYDLNNNYPEALTYYQKALQLYRQLKKDEMVARVLGDMAQAYEMMHKPEEALKSSLSSLEIINKSKNSDELFWSYFRLSGLYNVLKKFQEAHALNKLMLEIALEKKDTLLISNVYSFYASTFRSENDRNNYRKYELMSFDLLRNSKDLFARSNALLRISKLYLYFDEYEKALNYLDDFRKITLERNDLIGQREAAVLQYQASRALGKYKEALNYYTVYTTLKDSILKREQNDELRKKEMILDFEKTESARKLETEKQAGIVREEMRRQTIIRNSFIIGFIVILIITILLYRNYKAKQRSNIELAIKNRSIAQQKHLVEEKQKEIMDSIKYAKHLQEAILPRNEFLNSNLPDSFILYQPKDIVAGDFYWAEKIGDALYIAVADSTGHGVPGALVSVVCSTALNRALKEFKITETGKILDKTRELVVETFEKSESEVKDGMDISLLCLELKNKTVFWSGANNPLWYINTSQLIEIKGDKQHIGKTENPLPFTTHKIDLKENTLFYLFTDGLADQFGGPFGKKFKYKQFSDILIAHCNLTAEEQKSNLLQKFNDWKGSLEQVDDICVIAIRV